MRKSSYMTRFYPCACYANRTLSYIVPGLGDFGDRFFTI